MDEKKFLMILINVIGLGVLFGVVWNDLFMFMDIARFGVITVGEPNKDILLIEIMACIIIMAYVIYLMILFIKMIDKIEENEN